MLNRRLVTLAAAAVAVVIALALTGSGLRHHRAPPSTPRRQPSAWLVVQSVPPSLSAAAARTTPLVPVTDARTATTTTSFTTTILDGHRSTPTVTVEPTTTTSSIGRDPTAATERASRFVVMLTSWRYDTAPNDLTGLASANVIQQFRVPASELERRTSAREVAWAITTPTTLTVTAPGHVEVTLTVAQHVLTNTTGETVRSLMYTLVVTDQPAGWIVEDVRT
jgi:hypothetical protein